MKHLLNINTYHAFYTLSPSASCISFSFFNFRKCISSLVPKLSSHTFWTNYRLLPCRGFFPCPVTFLLQNTKEGGEVWSFLDGSTWCLSLKLGNFDYLSSLGSFICQIFFFYFYFSFSILQINISFAQVVSSKNAKHTFIAFPAVK